MITSSVSLHKSNLGHAAYIATCRHLKIFTSYGEDHPVMRDFDSIEILVRICQSEMAVAKAIDVPWDSQHFNGQQWLSGDQFQGACGGIVVRGVKDSVGPMVVTVNDPQNSPVILVRTNRKPEFDIVGWMWAADAWHFPSQDGVSVAVPAERLCPLETFPLRMLSMRHRI